MTKYELINEKVSLSVSQCIYIIIRLLTGCGCRVTVQLSTWLALSTCFTCLPIFASKVNKVFIYTQCVLNKLDLLKPISFQVILELIFFDMKACLNHRHGVDAVRTTLCPSCWLPFMKPSTQPWTYYQLLSPMHRFILYLLLLPFGWTPHWWEF